MDKGTLQQIERGDLVDNVVHEITEAIVEGRLQPGHQLVETEVGQQLGVSRGPVREAIRRLEQMGVIEKIPYRGAFVTVLTTRDVKELHDLREPLEGLAARLVAEQNGPEAATVRGVIIEEMRAVDAAGDQSLMVSLDAGFHDTLVELSGHKLLQELWVTISVRLRTFLLLKQERMYGTPEEAAALHEPIIAAIAQGDATRAEREARSHVAKAGRQHVIDWMNKIDGNG